MTVLMQTESTIYPSFHSSVKNYHAGRWWRREDRPPPGAEDTWPRPFLEGHLLVWHPPFLSHGLSKTHRPAGPRCPPPPAPARRPRTELGSPGSACTGKAGCRTERGRPPTSCGRRAPARSPPACWRSRPGRRRAPSGSSCNRPDTQWGSESERVVSFCFCLFLGVAISKKTSNHPGSTWESSAERTTSLES